MGGPGDLPRPPAPRPRTSGRRPSCPPRRPPRWRYRPAGMRGRHPPRGRARRELPAARLWNASPRPPAYDRPPRFTGPRTRYLPQGAVSFRSRPLPRQRSGPATPADRLPPSGPEESMTQQNHTNGSARPAPRVGIVGRGRLGTTLAAALREAGHHVEGPAGRGERASGEVLLLCVPDAEIPAAAAAVAGAAPLVGHTSGATPLAALEAADAAACFGLHPLQSFAGGSSAEAFRGAGCAVAGTTPAALGLAQRIARDLGMTPFAIDEDGRAAYHAAASVASNFLVTLEAAAERVAAGAGLEPEEARELLAPLVRSTVEGWATLGPERALTGPVARGDRATVEVQRNAVAETAPALLPLFDELVEHTEALA